MLRPVLAAALLLPVVAPAVAQDATAPAAAQQDPKAAYDELARSFGKAMNAWQDERIKLIKQAQEAGERPPSRALTPPTREFVSRAEELAKQHAGKPAAVGFLTFVIKNASRERSAVRRAIQALSADHAASEAIGDVLGHLRNARRFGAERQAMALLDRVAASNKDKQCRAKALVARGAMRIQSGDVKRGAEDLRMVPQLTDDKDLLAEAKEALFEVERLAIGTEAPDIEGIDVDGVPFKLSDYRGKVVLLDFWGFW